MPWLSYLALPNCRMNRWFLLLFLAFGIHATPRPNIVFIRADNLEIGDMKYCGEERGRIETPHLDRLAAEGLRFMDAHVPTRVGLYCVGRSISAAVLQVLGLLMATPA